MPTAPADTNTHARRESSMSNLLNLPNLPNSPQASLNSADILRGQKTVEITHNGATYRLQATRMGKLILTK